MILCIRKCLCNEATVRSIFAEIRVRPDIIISAGDISSPEILDFLSHLSRYIVGVIGENDDPSISKWLKTRGILLDGKTLTLSIGSERIKLAGLGVNVNQEVVDRLREDDYDIFVTYYPPLLLGKKFMRRYCVGYGFLDKIVESASPSLVVVGLSYEAPVIIEKNDILYLSPSPCYRGGYILLEYDLEKLRIISYR